MSDGRYTARPRAGVVDRLLCQMNEGEREELQQTLIRKEISVEEHLGQLLLSRDRWHLLEFVTVEREETP